tara:strand:+ start:2395 stop:3885 length:1491 start_codon:yes stop_codon:yes gene_type:complete
MSFNKDAYLNDPMFLVNWACRQATGVYLPSHYSNNYPNKDDWSYELTNVKCFGKDPKGVDTLKKKAIRNKNSLMLEFVDRPLATVDPLDGIAENIFKTNLIEEMKSIFNYNKENKHYRVQHILAPVVKGLKKFMDDNNIVEPQYGNPMAINYLTDAYLHLFLRKDSSWYKPLPTDAYEWLEKKVEDYYKFAVDNKVINVAVRNGQRCFIDSGDVYPTNKYSIFTTANSFFRIGKGYHTHNHDATVSEDEWVTDLSKKEDPHNEEFKQLRRWLLPILMGTEHTVWGDFWRTFIKGKGACPVAPKPVKFKTIIKKLCPDVLPRPTMTLTDMMCRRNMRPRGGSMGDWKYYHKWVTSKPQNNFIIMPEKGKPTGGWRGDGNKYTDNCVYMVEKDKLRTQDGYGDVQVAKKFWYPHFLSIIRDDIRDVDDRNETMIGSTIKNQIGKRKGYWEYINTVSPVLQSETHYGYKAWIKEREEDWKNRSYTHRYINDILEQHKVV